MTDSNEIKECFASKSMQVLNNAMLVGTCGGEDVSEGRVNEQGPELEFRFKKERDDVLLHQHVVPTSESFWITCQWAKVKVVACMNATSSSSMSMEFHAPTADDCRCM